MKRVFFLLVGLSMLVIGTLALFWDRTIPPQSPVQVAPETAAEPEGKPVPAIAYPLPLPDNAASSLPALDSSDRDIWTSLTSLQRSLGQFMRPERMIRNIVVTVDNLPRELVSERMRPVKPVSGAFRTEPEGQHVRIILAANAQRYQAHVRAFEAIDPDAAVAIYLRFYPLFQQAYQELGYPKQFFNDRLVGVIDHLLAAPEADADAELAQPRVLYEYADRELERASAGHKLMMRMGPDNARRVKAHLEKIRGRVLAASEQARAMPEGR